MHYSDIPDGEEIWDAALSNLDSSYDERAQTQGTVKGMGIGGVILYVNNRVDRVRDVVRLSSDDVKASFRIGGLIGANTRIVDDLLDGDGCEPVEDRRAFLDAYLHAYEEGELPRPRERDEEVISYRAANLLRSTYRRHDGVRDEMGGHLRDMADLVVEEDKSTIEGYQRYVSGSAAQHGELLVSALRPLETFDPGVEDYRFASDFSLFLQASDDLLDDDIALPEEDLREFHGDALERVKAYDDPVPSLLTTLLRYPMKSYRMFYRGVKASNSLQARPRSAD